MSTEIQKKIERIDKEDFELKEWFLKDYRRREDIFERLSFKPLEDISTYNYWPRDIPIKPLLSLYPTIYQKIYPSISNNVFKKVYGFSPEEIAILSKKKRVIMILGNEISKYPLKIIEPIIESEVYLTRTQFRLLRIAMMLEKGVFTEPLAEDILSLVPEKVEGLRALIEDVSCIKSVKHFLKIEILNFYGSTRSPEIEAMVKDMSHEAKVLLLLSVSLNADEALTASSLNSVLQHPNRWQISYYVPLSKSSIPEVGVFPIDESCNLDYIAKKLGIAYSEEMDLDDYLEMFNHRTTKSMRRVVNKIILEHDKRKENGVKLSRIIDEYNEKVKEICNTKRVKFAYSVSNLVSQNLESISAILFGSGFLSLTGSPFGFLAPIAQKLSGFEIPKEEREKIKIFLKENLSKLFVSPDVLQLHEVKEKLI